MLMESQDEPPLDDLYRKFASHLSRVQFVTQKAQTPSSLANILDGLRVNLEAWGDIVGYKNHVLEHVEREDHALADKTRQAFLTLLGDLEHVECWLRLRRDLPKDGVPLRTEAAMYLQEQFAHLLGNRTAEFTAFIHGRSKNGTRQSSLRAAPTQQSNSNGREYSLGTSNSQVGHRYHQPSTHQRPPAVSSQSMYTLPSSGHRSSYSTHLATRPAFDPSSQMQQWHYSSSVPTTGQVTTPEQLSSRPSTSGSPVPPTSTQAPPKPTSITTYPSISQLLHSPDASTEEQILHTPSTSSLSARSSPMTPFCSPTAIINQTTLSNLEDWSHVTLSPMLPSHFSRTGLLQVMEPRFENYVDPSQRADSSRFHLRAWGIPHAHRNRPFDRRSGLF